MIFSYSDLVNCSCPIASGTETTNISDCCFNANNGWSFSTVGVGIPTNITLKTSGTIVTFKFSNWFVRQDNNSKYQLSLPRGYNLSDISEMIITDTLSASVENETKTLNVVFTGTFNNCTANFQNGSKVRSGSVLTVTANTDYKMVYAEYDYQKPRAGLTIGTSVKYFTLSANNTFLTYTFTEEDILTASTAVTINGNFYADPIVSQDSLSVIFSNANFVNCVANVTDGEQIIADEYGNIKELTITANDGFEFNGVFSVDFDVEGYSEFLHRNKNVLYIPLYDTTLNYNNTVTFSGDYTATLKPQETLSDFVRIFNPTDEELSGLSKATFYNLISGSSVPISSYITALYKIPFDVSGLRLADKANIILANYDSQVKSTMLSNWVLETDGGQIIIEPKYNNVFDYINLKCFIYIPYFGKAEIDIERVMSHTLTITYYTNLYEGMVTVDVESDFGGTKVFTSTKKVGFDIPYVQLSSVSAITEINIPILENDLNAFVEIVRDMPITNTEIFGKRTVKSVRLNELSGYQVIEDIELNALIPDNMQTEIRQLLRNGVFV